jgi:dTDP-4-dehydrorhamnose reductase
MKILILGHNGMLGHMTKKYFNSLNEFEIHTTDFRWPTEEFKNYVEEFDGEYIINCIGAIHQRTKRFEINWELPIYLDFYTKSKIIHPGTDCEMDNDNYGISKRIARNYIINDSIKTKSIKTSILGPEKNTRASLMEWFLSNEDGTTVKGFSEYYWNGNTTLTWAKNSHSLILNWDKFKKETILSSKCISKEEILNSINDVFNKQIKINSDNSVKFNKCLNGDIETEHIKEQLKELKEFYYN